MELALMKTTKNQTGAQLEVLDTLTLVAVVHGERTHLATGQTTTAMANILMYR